MSSAISERETRRERENRLQRERRGRLRMDPVCRERMNRLRYEYCKRRGDEYRERQNRLHSERYRTHPELRERRNCLMREWRRTHPESRSATRHRRRAMKNNASGSFSASDIKVLLTKQKGRCSYCNALMNGKATVDHVIPLVHGGSNDPSNLVMACGSCNSRKRTRTAEEFRLCLGIGDEHA